MRLRSPSLPLPVPPPHVLTFGVIYTILDNIHSFHFMNINQFIWQSYQTAFVCHFTSHVIHWVARSLDLTPEASENISPDSCSSVCSVFCAEQSHQVWKALLTYVFHGAPCHKCFFTVFWEEMDVGNLISLCFHLKWPWHFFLSSKIICL